MPVRAVADALRSRRGRLKWRPLSRSAAALVRRHSLVAPAALSLAAVSARDTGALEPGGKIYVVENGDYPTKIASKLVGNASRWKELVKANPQKKVDPATGNFKTLYAGEKLNVPESWWPQTMAKAPAPVPQVQPSSPLPGPSAPPTEAAQSTVAMLQAKGTLAAWGKTDGAAEPGYPDYGLTPADAVPVWSSRDSFMLVSFSKWWNASRSPKLAETGQLTQAHVDALKAWVESKASAATGGAVPSSPSSPTITATSPGQPTGTPAPPGSPVPGAPPAPAPTGAPSDLLSQAAQAAAAAAQAGAQSVGAAAPGVSPAPSAAAKSDDGGALPVLGALAALAALLG